MTLLRRTGELASPAFWIGATLQGGRWDSGGLQQLPVALVDAPPHACWGCCRCAAVRRSLLRTAVILFRSGSACT